VIERSCSLAGTAHRIAFCQAVESATGATLSLNARLTRVLFAEIERILARLWLLAMVSRAAGQPATLRDALAQREALFEALESATGQRRYWAIALPGGIRGDLDLDGLTKAIDDLVPALDVWRAAVAPTGPLGRAGQGVGILSADHFQALSLSGIAATGSDTSSDLRRSAPYGGYKDIEYEWPASEGATSDIAGRLRAAVEDIATSVDLAQAAAQALADETQPSATPAELKAPAATAKGESRVEGPHGPVRLSLALTHEQKITDLRLETPGNAVLAALPAALEGRLISQAPAILASLDLCMECLDQ
jgi:Ni,Fe-hydrogenase III large subunit